MKFLNQVNKSSKKEDSNESSLLATLHDLVFLVAIVLIIFSVFFRVVVVSGNSMNDTLVDGDWMFLVSNVFYKNPQRGDIIVASKDSFDNGSPIIKRVIAIEGDKVNIDFDLGIVYVNDEPLSEDYITDLTYSGLYGGMEYPLVVEKGTVFAMGDNRNKSKDSRYIEIGLIDKREILGKAVFLFMPGSDSTHPKDWGRVGGVS